MLNTRSPAFPLPSKQNIEIDFIESQKRRFYPRPTVPRYVGLGPSSERRSALKRTQDSFIAALEVLTKSSKGETDTQIANFSLSDTDIWDHLIQAATVVEAKYLSTESFSDKIQAAFRKVGNNARSIKPFVGLLLDGNYKTLCEGLTIILTVDFLS
ncbi:hypothetical protein P154DRAFT_580290 [Amniculicola lignicola CBS 123094]|uniref:Uncharacterized protein n=1 Tax=Amniculicola lignicola CBS 123094 TaxID=1392246 RepID=A0A6A5WA91_9PLEO|nr:hypothetical protein P154DRAFT_580290 [Amniculicola lignicola CBS 123094]